MPLTRVGKWAVVYGVVAVEMAAITGSYLQWKKLNSSQGHTYLYLPQSIGALVDDVTLYSTHVTVFYSCDSVFY